MSPTPSNCLLILTKVSEAFEVHIAEILSRKRSPQAVRARWAALWLMQNAMGACHQTLAKLTGFERTRILKAIKAMKQAIDVDVDFKIMLEALFLSLQGHQEPPCHRLEASEQSLTLSCGCELWREMPSGKGRPTTGATGIKLCGKHSNQET